MAMVNDAAQRSVIEDREATIEALRLLTSRCSARELMSGIIEHLRKWSGCEAVGIRIRNGKDFPYIETIGLPEEFVAHENSLFSIDQQGEPELDDSGQPLLECMCGRIVSGRLDPGESFFTSFGSFWTNSTTDLIAEIAEAEENGSTRNVCHAFGFESVALIPLRTGGETFGLLQFNDRRRDCFTPELISFLERLGATIGIALAERKSFESLRSSEEKYRMIFNNSAIGILHFDKTGRVTDCNDKLSAIMGAPRTRIIGFNMVDSLKDPQMRATVTEALAGRLGSYEGDYVSVLGGKTTPLIATFCPIFSSDCTQSGGVAIFEDATERRLFEESMMASLKEKETLLKELYHRTKNNMQVIYSLLNLQALTGNDQKTSEIIREIQNRIRAISLVHEKLYRSREVSNIDLSDYVTELSSAILLSYNVEDKMITLALDLEPLPVGIDVAIPCGLVINELMTNSLKYAFPNGKGGEIRLSLHASGNGETRLTLGDNGIGLPTGFDFRKAPSLGLRLVCQLVESQLKGKIELGPARPGGTEFSVSFNERALRSNSPRRAL